jgi:hypothetical protein
MKDTKVLATAIRMAIANGWAHNEYSEYYDDYCMILGPSFARALWGDAITPFCYMVPESWESLPPSRRNFEANTVLLPAWKGHLMGMVAASNPTEYLAVHLPNTQASSTRPPVPDTDQSPPQT